MLDSNEFLCFYRFFFFFFKFGCLDYVKVYVFTIFVSFQKLGCLILGKVDVMLF